MKRVFVAYIQALGSRVLNLLSGVIGVVLMLAAPWIPQNWAKISVLTAGFLAVLFAHVLIWHAERILRLQLEKESGPSILMSFAAQDAYAQTFTIINDGTESAVDLSMSVLDGTHRISLWSHEPHFAFLQANTSLDIPLQVSKQTGPNSSTLAKLHSLLWQDQISLEVVVRFRNASNKAVFQRRFTLQATPREIQCFPGPREQLDDSLWRS